LIFAPVLLTLPARADEETCAACDRLVQASGDFTHYRADTNVPIQGTTTSDDAVFHEEIHGTHFTITVSHLPKGTYTVIIGEAEAFFKEPGQRVFNVTCGGMALAKDFDIAAAAGGPDKVCTISGQIEHQADSVQGPLALVFAAVKNEAKFNTLQILDASGNALVSLNASDLADPLTPAYNRLPVVTGPEIWKDPSQPLDTRVHDLISRMSLAEKVSEIRDGTPCGYEGLLVDAYYPLTAFVTGYLGRGISIP
jgi:hypothetical protein